MKTPFNYAILLVSLSFLLFAPRADAVIYLLGATIDGAQANAGAGTGSMGIGSMTGSYDDGGTPAAGGTFAWNVNWSGLSGVITVAHFHGPAAAGMNAGVQVNFGSISGLTSPSIGSTPISAVQATDLLNGLWYANIHSTVDPGGEIRGQVQVIPEASSVILTAAGVLLVGFRRRR